MCGSGVSAVLLHADNAEKKKKVPCTNDEGKAKLSVCAAVPSLAYYRHWVHPSMSGAHVAKGPCGGTHSLAVPPSAAR